MATRKETQKQRRVVEEALRSLLRDARATPGVVMPSVREIAQTHGVTNHIAHQALRTLADEGLFRAVPKVGMFAGESSVLRSNGQPREEYVFIYPTGSPSDRDRHVRRGFEDAVALAGGAALTWSAEQAWQFQQDGVPAVAGVFEWGAWLDCELFGTARVWFGDGAGAHDPFGRDSISFDDHAGGRQVTQHLLEEGHRDIAFVALHTASNQNLHWSQAREEGWRALLCERGLEPLSFHPGSTVSEFDAEEHAIAAREVARIFVEEGGYESVSAVVVANDPIALELLKELRRAGVPRDKWPALAGFDDDSRSDLLLTSARLPWEEIGRAAAEMLWQRHHNLTSGATHRCVAMKLIPRLTCRTDWASSGHVSQPAMLAPGILISG